MNGLKIESGRETENGTTSPTNDIMNGEENYENEVDEPAAKKLKLEGNIDEEMETNDEDEEPASSSPTPDQEPEQRRETEPACNGGKKSAPNGETSLVDSFDEDADDPGVPDETSLVPVEEDSDAGSKYSDVSAPESSSYESVLKNITADSFKHLTKSELEELLVQKICEAITERSVTGEMRRRAEMVEEEVVKWKAKAHSIQKQVHDLAEVLKKCVADLNVMRDRLPIPQRVSRSVGLQVSFNSSTKTRRRPLQPAIPATGKLESVEVRPTPTYSRTLLKSSSLVNIRPKPACKILPYNSVPTMLVPIVNGAEPPAIPNKTVLNLKCLLNSQVVDLTDEEPDKKRRLKPVSAVAPLVRPQGPAHPAPMPMTPSPEIVNNPSWKAPPPRPFLTLASANNGKATLKATGTPESDYLKGIVLSWDMEGDGEYEEITKYQLFAYQETSEAPHASLWRLIGEVKALSLPMACTLQCFVPGFKYHFTVRAVDIHDRQGPFSLPGTILLKPHNAAKNPTSV